MRSEKEMYDLILGYANADENIRAVILNGSRANPNRKPDPFNDFDIVYLVRDLTPCKEKAYYKDFGEILVCERTDESELFKEHFPEFVCYLMQFADGNRIDLTVSSIDRWEGYCYDDRLSVVLLDKDNALPKLPEPNESTHCVKKPTERMFFDCRTEFWWVSPYVSKGLWRGQLLFAQTHMESCIRKETFAVCTEEDIWRALFKAGELFTELTKRTAKALGFTVTDEYDRRVTSFLKYTKDLPRNAKTLDFHID